MSAVAIELPIKAAASPLVIVEAPVTSELPPTCLQIEKAIWEGDRKAACAALRAFKQHLSCRKARFVQLQCLRMRVEYKNDPAALQLLMDVLRT